LNLNKRLLSLLFEQVPAISQRSPSKNFGHSHLNDVEVELFNSSFNNIQVPSFKQGNSSAQISIWDEQLSPLHPSLQIHL